MSIVEKLEEFASWPREIQDACIYHVQSTSPATQSAPPQVKAATAGAENKNKRWTDEDRLLLFSLFEQHGLDPDLKSSWAKRFGRTVRCIEAQYHKEYLAYVARSTTQPSQETPNGRTGIYQIVPWGPSQAACESSECQQDQPVRRDPAPATSDI